MSLSEVHAYKFILDQLSDKKGWSKKNIYTQQECRKIKPIKESLGLLTPENIVKIRENIYYIIESKNEREKIDQALNEAIKYADLINEKKIIESPFVTGIAGNIEEGFIGKSKYFDNGEWKTIKENDIELTGLLSEYQVDLILNTKNPEIKEVEVSEEEFLKSAENINNILHEGGINKDYRARVMSALLLALSEGTDLNLDEKPSVLITAINSRVDLVLNKHKKPNFSRYIKIELPSSTDNHNKFKTAIVLTIQELLGLNIRSAMNSGKDILGKFYEVFLKYGNGAKEIGIVLTPRHITKFVAETLDVDSTDMVLDPTCGTGGFLVSAFDEVKRKIDEKEFNNFKKYGLYGIEQQDPIVALSLVNMIFRGDGKNNIIEGDCFRKWLHYKSIKGINSAVYLNENKKDRIPPITKVMMNPPFPKKKTDYKEYLFIEQALKQMQNKGFLFSVLPYSCMIKQGSYVKWRKRLLNENTLLCVITFPEDLFYPVGVTTVGIFVQKGIPHPKNKNVLWVRALNDGFKKKKGKRMRHKDVPDDFVKIKQNVKDFLHNKIDKVENIPKFQKTNPINFSDSYLELCPEAYLDSLPMDEKTVQKNIDKLIRENIAFKIKYEKKIREIEDERTR